MNYNPQNESGLLGLVAALKAGMDPSTAQSIFSGIQQDQGALIAQRQQRLSGLADLLTQNAQAGMPYSGAQAIADAQPGPSGPAVQQMLQSLYPTQDIPIPSEMQPGGGTVNPNAAPGTPNIEPSPWGIGQPMPAGMQQATQGQAQSPAYQPDPMAQAQLQTAQAQAATATQGANFAAEWPVFQQAMTMARAKGLNPFDAYQQFVAHSPDNAALVASDPGTVKSIMENIWGQLALQTASAPQG